MKMTQVAPPLAPCSLEVLLDSNELERVPILGDYVRRNSGRLPQVCPFSAALAVRGRGELAQ